MSESKHYIFNSRTLSYELKTQSRKSRVVKTLALFVLSLALAVFYFWLYVHVLGLELPKTVMLKKENARWCSRVEVLNRQLDQTSEALVSLQMRDDEIYRSIFGMNEIPSEVRHAGFGGVNRYAHYDDIDPNGLLKSTAVRLDMLTKKAYVQSKSFDEVAALSRRAGEMASCIPAIPPMNPDPKIYRYTSAFGYRSDPFTGRSKRHTGVDFAMKPGHPADILDDILSIIGWDVFEGKDPSIEKVREVLELLKEYIACFKVKELKSVEKHLREYLSENNPACKPKKARAKKFDVEYDAEGYRAGYSGDKSSCRRHNYGSDVRDQT